MAAAHVVGGQIFVHEDEATAIDRGIDGAHFFGYSLAHYYVFGDHRPGRTDIYEEFLRRRDEVGFARSIITADDAPLGVRVLQQGLGSLRGAIGTPDQIRHLIQEYEDAGVDQVLLIMQTETVPHEKVLRSLELFGIEVLPKMAKEVAAPLAAILMACVACALVVLWPAGSAAVSR